MEGGFEDFNKSGYVVLDSVFSPEELIELNEITEKLIEGANEEVNQHNDGHWNSQGYLFNKQHVAPDHLNSRHLHKIQGVCVLNSNLLEKIFKHPKILSAVKEISRIQPLESVSGGGSMDVFGTKFYPVFPGGNSVSWHQDSHYFGTGPSQQIISCAVYLEKTDVENGCFRLIPGSHCDGTEHVHAQGEGKWTQGEWIDVEGDTMLRSRVVDLECPIPGTVVLFDARLLHAANENTSTNRTRCSFFAHYVPGELQFSWRGVNFSEGCYKDRHVVFA